MTSVTQRIIRQPATAPSRLKRRVRQAEIAKSGAKSKPERLRKDQINPLKFPHFSPVHNLFKPPKVKPGHRSVYAEYAVNDKEKLISVVSGKGSGDLEYEALNIMLHIEGVHIKPYEFQTTGIPRYDIERAVYFNLDLTPYVVGPKQTGCLLDYLKKSPQELMDQFELLRPVHSGSDDYLKRRHMSVGEFRQWIVKTIVYMKETGAADFEWSVVEELYPGARHVTVDIARDSNDLSFHDETGNHYVDSRIR